MKTLLVAFNSKYIHSALGICSVAAFCRWRGHEAEVMEFTLQTPLLSALAQIFQQQPKVLGIAVHIWNRQLSFELADMAKKVLPYTLIVLGGPEVSYDAEAVLMNNPAVDFVVQGEGEEVFAALATDIAQGGSGRGVPGVALRSGKGVDLQGGAQTVNDLSVLPFAYNNILPDDKIVYYESSRGCPFTCAYCLSGISRSVRYKPLTQVCGELGKLTAAGVKQVKFVDRTYNLDKHHYLPLMRWLAGQDTAANFHFEIKADTLNEEELDFLATVPPGRFQFEIGVQSLHEKTLEASGRSQDWGKLAHNVKKLREAVNIHIHLDLIAGLPYEGLEGFGASFNAVYALQPHMLQLGFLKLLKGSLLERQTAEYGYIFMTKPPYEILGNKFISYEELRRLKIMEEVFELTYNTGRFFYTLEFLLTELYQDQPFNFYMTLAEWWGKADLAFASHNARTVVDNLAVFIKEKWPERAGQALDCLKLDIILFQDKNLRPAYLDWQDKKTGSLASLFWRQQTVVEKYLPGYVFDSWRQTNSKYQIECFQHYFPGPGAHEQPLFVLFEKENKQRLWQIIDKQDIAGLKIFS